MIDTEPLIPEMLSVALWIARHRHGAGRATLRAHDGYPFNGVTTNSGNDRLIAGAEGAVAKGHIHRGW